METLDAVQRDIRGILQQQAAAPKPSAAICAVISNLRDLVELGTGFQNDWRRGAPEAGGFGRFRNSSGTLDSSPRTPRSDGLSRVASHKSFHSDSGGSPVGSPPPPVAKYHSKFKNSTQQVEDKILNNIILSKLNKFSAKTYAEIRDFLYQILGSGEVADLQEMIRDFMKLVFRKAAIEEVFCPLYAKLLCEISQRYRVILEEMHTLQSNYLTIFDDIQDTEAGNYDAFVEHQKSKQYRQGYSQFLAELTALEILDLDLLNSTFQRILTNMAAFGKQEEKKTLLEDYSDCLLRMAKVLRKRPGAFFGRARQVLLANNAEVLNDLVDNHASYQSISAKTKFVLMDVVDILKGL
jgi:hypothetical protein